MNTLEIPHRKIYCRLLLKINEKSVLPYNYISNKDILYIQKKEDSSKEFGIVKLKKGIHYKYITEKSKNYNIYNDYLNISSQIDHSSEDYDDLIKNFSLKLLEENKVLLKKVQYRKRYHYEIIDGCHRLSIYFSQYEKLNPKYFMLVNEH
tara:strand:- start:4134 stop:4583 length:450 start_codon:yes stop_codon:yes gene_type:complete